MVEGALGVAQLALAAAEEEVRGQRREREGLAVKCLALGADREEYRREADRKGEIVRALEAERRRLIDDAEGSIEELEMQLTQADARARQGAEREKVLEEEVRSVEAGLAGVLMRVGWRVGQKERRWRLVSDCRWRWIDCTRRAGCWKKRVGWPSGRWRRPQGGMRR